MHPSKPKRTPKQIRKARGLSLIAAAVGAGVAEATARIFEIDRNAVTDVPREKLDKFYRAPRRGVLTT